MTFKFDPVGVRGHFLVEVSSATRIPLGSRVRVGDHPFEREERGFEGTLTGFTKVHGYAAVYDEASDEHRLIHPEALEALP